MSDPPIDTAVVPVILVLGLTGAGKSFFIDKATEKFDVKIEDGLEPKIQGLTALTIEIDGHKVSLLETIVLDGPWLTDKQILTTTASWLAEHYVHGVPLAGVIFMHDIASTQHLDIAESSLRIFKRLIGDKKLDNMTFVTTQWDHVDSAKGRIRMLEDRWERMLDGGCTMESFDGTPEGAHDILRKILVRERGPVLNIQKEFVDQELDLLETAAGKLIREEVGWRNPRRTPQLTEQGSTEKRLTEQRSITKRLTKLQRRLPRFLEVQSHSGAQGQGSHHGTSAAFLNPGRSLLAAFFELIRKLVRPRVPPGHRRLEWTCTCGEVLYGDFSEATPASLERLAAKLKQHSGQGSQQGNPAPIQTPGKAHVRQVQPVGWNMPGGSGSSSRPSAPSNPVANVATAAGPTIVKPPPPIALQLCIETGKYSLELSALNSSAATSDGAVFARIREQYERTRRSILPMWARFKKPDKAIFVKFTLGKRPFVSLISGTLETPQIPPATEVSHNYDYGPCPMDAPPMDSRTFFHHFYAPEALHPDVIWSERLPWKVGPALEPKAHGWGIHLEERPNWPLFAALMCVLLLLSGVVAGIYGWKMEDAQTGVAVGAWLTSVQVMGVTAVFFWWS